MAEDYKNVKFGLKKTEAEILAGGANSIIKGQHWTASDTLQIIQRDTVTGAFFKPKAKIGEPVPSPGSLHCWNGTAFVEIDLPENIGTLYEAQESGVFSGGIPSQLSSTEIEISAGSGHLVDANTDPQNPPNDTDLVWALTTHTPPVTDALNVYFIYRDVSNTVFFGLGIPNEAQRRDTILHGYYVTENNIIKGVAPAAYRANQLGTKFNSYIYYMGLERTMRGISAKAIAGALSFYTTAGTQFLPDGNPTNTNDSSVIDIPAVGSVSTPANFATYNYLGQDTAVTPGIVPKLWDNAGTPTAITGNDAVIHYLYIDILGNLYLQLGNTLYDSATQARDNLLPDTNTFVPYPVLANATGLVAQIYISNGATEFDGVLAGVVPPSGIPGTGGTTNPTWDSTMKEGNSTTENVILDTTGKANTVKVLEILKSGVSAGAIFADGAVQWLKSTVGELLAGGIKVTNFFKSVGVSFFGTETDHGASVNVEGVAGVVINTYSFVSSNGSVYDGDYEEGGTHNGFPYYVKDGTYYIQRGNVTGFGWVWGAYTSLVTGDVLWASAPFIQLNAVADGNQNSEGLTPDLEVYDGRASEETNAATATEIPATGRIGINTDTIKVRNSGEFVGDVVVGGTILGGSTPMILKPSLENNFFVKVGGSDSVAFQVVSDNTDPQFGAIVAAQCQNSSIDAVGGKALVTKEYGDLKYISQLNYSANGIADTGHRIDIVFGARLIAQSCDVSIVVENSSNTGKVALMTVFVNGDGEAETAGVIVEGSSSVRISEPTFSGTTLSFYIDPSGGSSYVKVEVEPYGDTNITSVSGANATYTGTELAPTVLSALNGVATGLLTADTPTEIIALGDQGLLSGGAAKLDNVSYAFIAGTGISIINQGVALREALSIVDTFIQFNSVSAGTIVLTLGNSAVYPKWSRYLTLLELNTGQLVGCNINSANGDVIVRNGGANLPDGTWRLSDTFFVN